MGRTRLLPLVIPEYSPASWEGGEAVIRFQPGPIFSGRSRRLLGACELAQSRQSATWIWAAVGPLLVDVARCDAFPSRRCLG